MRAAPKLLWIVLLAFLVSGCTTYRHGLLPMASETAAGTEQWDPVAVGDAVRLTLISGDRTEGRVGELGNGGILLVGRGNFAYEDLFISYSEIEQVEIREPSDSDIEALWLSGIAIAVVVSGFLAFMSYGWN